MSLRDVVISGIGPVCGQGLGASALWQGLLDGRGRFGPIRAFDASAFASPFASEVPEDFKLRDYVPKSYRKAAKVMARDIELAVAGAQLAAQDAGVLTRARIDLEGIADRAPQYESPRMGAQIGAGLIASDLDELTSALAGARDQAGQFDIHLWGERGINDLTPLWLLKYLPNMLACHVTILHDAQGPSNTITCGEVSALHSVGEATRLIGRGAVDLCFCGGMESKINPMSHLRQIFTGRLLEASADIDPATALRPFDRKAAGSIAGEGGAILILEALETFERRRQEQTSLQAYARIKGYAATQTLNPKTRNLTPDSEGTAIAMAIRLALEDARIAPEDVDLVIPFGAGHPAYDSAERNALASAFGSALPELRICPIRPMVGLCGAGTGGLDLCAAVLALHHQAQPAVINCDEPLTDLNVASGPSRPAKIEHVLVLGTALGGQNAAIVLSRP
ncbi:MAG: hypothetical protein JJU36_16445 [Phycisphaeraceae bacterium]|nr:hypothetical protein [Phycisphaeraceae bacterium]